MSLLRNGDVLSPDLLRLSAIAADAGTALQRAKEQRSLEHERRAFELEVVLATMTDALLIVDVSGAVNGVEGLVLQRARPADVVVTDIFMPEMEGIETIHDLRRAFPEVKVIAMSGRDPRMKFDVFEVARQIGAARTFKKPFRFEELIAAVRELSGTYIAP